MPAQPNAWIKPDRIGMILFVCFALMHCISCESITKMFLTLPPDMWILPMKGHL